MHECTHVWRTYIPIHRYAWINTYLFTDIHIAKYMHICTEINLCIFFLLKFDGLALFDS